MISILGQNLKKIRTEKGLSAYKLSKLARVGTTTISEIENGKRQSLNSTTIEKIANALNISTDRLMDVEENKEYIVTDIEQTIKLILTSDELVLDDIKLSDNEKLQIESALNATFAMIRSQRSRNS
ncbi:helix-turn-helix domain-containing protein [Clostridium botulinum]|uniref:helix-turn-helix domain-containing protein n=1 Tax=Clostridium botulinum TaxID=1491 RepID=UPI000463D7B9|nr:helix-turn-helix transcriptional regulator [Clostridium botulinum]MBY6898767.1 helix-turn-helix transcriptional regulator [Clostridium botulinum]MBY6914507.1 helix-turn-helix transcriptional regulator [Clostridium botulinum]QDY21748.1 XRE family transcriptional regulator [Clostridium botulinum]